MEFVTLLDAVIEALRCVRLQRATESSAEKEHDAEKKEENRDALMAGGRL